MKKMDLILLMSLFLIPLSVAFFLPINSLEKGYLGAPKPLFTLKMIWSNSVFEKVVFIVFLLKCLLLPLLVYWFNENQILSWTTLIAVALFAIPATALLLLAFLLHEKNLISTTQIYSMNIWGYTLVTWSLGTALFSCYLVVKKIIS